MHRFFFLRPVFNHSVLGRGPFFSNILSFTFSYITVYHIAASSQQLNTLEEIINAPTSTHVRIRTRAPFPPPFARFSAVKISGVRVTIQLSRTRTTSVPKSNERNYVLEKKTSLPLANAKGKESRFARWSFQRDQKLSDTYMIYVYTRCTYAHVSSRE